MPAIHWGERKGTADDSGDRTRRRMLLAGAAGLTGTAVAAGTATPAAAATGSDGFDAKEYGAVGNAAADDTGRPVRTRPATTPIPRCAW